MNGSRPVRGFAEPPPPGWVFRNLRWVLYTLLLCVALLMAASAWTVWQAERQRATDAELVALAGAQRMLSQRVALLALQPNGDEGALELSLQRARREAARVDELLGANDKLRFAELPAGLAIAALQWKTARERLWNGSRAFALARHGNSVAPSAADFAVLRTEADATLETSQELVDQARRHAEAKSSAARLRLAAFGKAGVALILLLAFAAVEPAVRFARRQHERLASLAQRVGRLDLVAGQIHNVVVITDVQRRIVWVNDAFTRLCGFGLDEVIGHKPSELLQTSQTDATTTARIRATLDRGEGVQARLLNQARDGRVYWLDLDIRPIVDASDALVGFIAIETEVSEQVFERDRLRALLDAMPAGVVEHDADGAVVQANRMAQQALGLTRDPLLGRLSADGRWHTVHDDLTPYPGEQHAIQLSLRDGTSVRGDSMGVIAPQADPRWLLINSEPLRNPAGTITGAVACFVDVTHQRAQRTLLQLAVDAGNIGTWNWRVGSEERIWSTESCGMLGFSQEEFAPLLPAWRERIHPDDRAWAKSLMTSYLDHPVGFYRCEMRIRHRAGHWVWVQTFGIVAERDGAGQPHRIVGVHFDISQRKRHEQQLQASALRDPLTGLPNRTDLLQHLERCVADREGDPDFHFAVIFLNFDRFKQTNDMLGHAGGDELLVQIGERLEEMLRTDLAALSTEHGSGSLVARLGSDEFALLVTGLQRPADAYRLTDRLLQLLTRPYEVRGQAVHSSASAGVVTSDLAADNADSLLQDADTAMHEAKRAGRGLWEAFDPAMRERANQRAGIETDLRLALQRDELFVVYQPVLALDDPAGDRGCAGVEALVRWRHPVRGLVGPVEFIPVAEESGLIVALGSFVLETACGQFMRWRLELGKRAPALLAVNLSVAQLRQADLVEQVRRALVRYAMPAAALQLEVTESLAAQDPVAQARLRELKGLGVKLALDDFGTGYSSLACLHQMPVDTVKIDRSFVIEAERSEYHRALIEATVRVAHTLRMATVAEGVETAEQARLITALGCDKGQGYLYSRPLESDALMAWLVARSQAVEA